MAKTAITLAATVWAVTFVFDGFVAPNIVRRMTPETGLYQLAVNQDAVIRLGLVSWLALGFAMIAGSVGTLLSCRSGGAKVLAWIGIPLGAWPFIAWATGHSFLVLSRAGIGMSALSARHSGSLLSESFYWFLRRHRTEWSPRARDRAWITF